MSKKLLAALIALCIGSAVIACLFGRESRFPFTREVSLCPSLKALPTGEEQGIINKVTTVNIPGILAPYNPSLVVVDDGFLLVFRHDIKERRKVLGIPTLWKKKIPFGELKMPLRSRISAAYLDANFHVTSRPVRIDTGSEFSEDPRVFSMKDQVYITFNDIEDNNIESRTIHLAKLDRETFKISDHVNLAQNFRRIEKNWVPFVYEENGTPQIHFGYYFNPHVILQMKDPTKNELVHLLQPNYAAVQRMPWKDSWGEIRGGTPCILVDGQYVGFFHSFFKENGKIWYVMGAYTFESTPPFRITACSSHPICFKGMYKTKIKNTGSTRKPVVFPSGIVLAQEGGKDVFHVSCGDNDCGIKIVTFDKEALLKNLQPIPLYKGK